MAAIDIYVPVYMEGKPGTGNEGKKAYQFAKLTGVVTFQQVPEGAVCINSRVVTSVPPAKLQPEE